MTRKLPIIDAHCITHDIQTTYNWTPAARPLFVSLLLFDQININIQPIIEYNVVTIALQHAEAPMADRYAKYDPRNMRENPQDELEEQLADDEAQHEMDMFAKPNRQQPKL